MQYVHEQFTGIYTRVVQAKADGHWWDCKYAANDEEAYLMSAELILSRSSWMNSPSLAERAAMTRVWPIEAANCYRKLRSEGRA